MQDAISLEALIAQLVLWDCTNGGGAICQSSSGLLTLKGCAFTNNVAAYGGAIYQGGGRLIADRCAFTRNTALGYGQLGGGIYAEHGGNVTLTNCVFVNNTAYSDIIELGSSLSLYGASNSATIANCTFYSNATDA